MKVLKNLHTVDHDWCLQEEKARQTDFKLERKKEKDETNAKAEKKRADELEQRKN